MKRILFLTALIALLLQAHLSNFAQQPSAPTVEAELVDSTNHDGIDAFSDTTSVDTGTVEIVSQHADADSDDEDFLYVKKFMGTSSGILAALIGIVSVLFLFTILLSPFLLIQLEPQL